jgi:uncharacterized repeat protein (TIGR04138 family)
MAMDIEGAILEIAERYGRYKPNAYRFTYDAVHYTVQRLREIRHVTGAEVLDGIRELALSRFGIMSKTVFEQWGVGRTEDFGEIVFHLVEEGLLGKTETDKPSDFDRGYDFEDAFVRGFDWLDRMGSERRRQPT